MICTRGKWLVLLFVIITLTSCTFARGNNSDITITLSGWQSSPNESQLLRRVLRDFEAEYPKIKVKYEVINQQYMDVIKTRLIGDTAPDVFYLDAFEAPLLMQNNVLEPLNSYINYKFDLTDFIPALLNAFKHQEKIYGLPKDFSTLAIFYNQQAFKAAKLIKPPTTWTELREDSQKLTKDWDGDRRIDQYGLGIIPELSRQSFLIKTFGGTLIDQNGYATFATPEGLKGLQLIVDLYCKYRTAAQPSDVGVSTGSEMFGQGKAAIVIEGSWAIPYLKETFPKLKFATAELPTIAGKKGTMAYTVAYVMNKRTKHKDAAWKLIAYLTSKKGMKAWANQGLVLPSRQSVIAELGYDQNPLYAPFVAGADYATIWQAGETLPTVLMHFNNQFISALIGEQSLNEAMQRAQVSANQEIAESR